MRHLQQASFRPLPSSFSSWVVRPPAFSTVQSFVQDLVPPPSPSERATVMRRGIQLLARIEGVAAANSAQIQCDRLVLGTVQTPRMCLHLVSSLISSTRAKH